MNHLVTAAQDGVHVELTPRCLGRPGHAACLGERLRRTKQRLGGHARVIGAFAADQLPLDERDGQPVLSETTRAHLAGRPGAEHDHIELSNVRHALPFAAGDLPGRRDGPWTPRRRAVRSIG
jgi:hypothetical protein